MYFNNENYNVNRIHILLIIYISKYKNVLEVMLIYIQKYDYSYEINIQL